MAKWVKGETVRKEKTLTQTSSPFTRLPVSPSLPGCGEVHFLFRGTVWISE